MSESRAVAAILLMAAITAGLRCAPFLLFGGKKEPPKFILYLGEVLPYAIMGMLVVYCLKGTSFRSLSGFLPQLIAGLVTAVSYVLKKNTLLSIIAGTVCYMLLVQFVF